MIRGAPGLAYRRAAWPPVLHVPAEDARIVLTGPLAGRLGWGLRSARLRGHATRDILFAGPWLGEFGWELMNWQGFVRALRPRFERVVVCSRSGSEDLYADACDDFISHDIRCRPNCHAGLNIEDAEALRQVLEQVPEGAVHLRPRAYVPSGAQRFVRYGKRSRERRLDVLVHARGQQAYAERNWSREKWQAFVDQARRNDWRIGAIGLRGGTLDLEGVDDLRGLPLRETMNRLASAGVVVGPSSGPMHLASLCGAPHLVWADRRTYSMRKTSREKYETWWNPLRTPVTVLDEDGFDPPVEHVVSEAARLLKPGKT